MLTTPAITRTDDDGTDGTNRIDDISHEQVHGIRRADSLERVLYRYESSPTRAVTSCILTAKSSQMACLTASRRSRRSEHFCQEILHRLPRTTIGEGVVADTSTVSRARRYHTADVQHESHDTSYSCGTCKHHRRHRTLIGLVSDTIFESS